MLMKKFLLIALLVPAFSLALAASDDDANMFSARLRGLNEVPPVATAATGSFSATLSSDGTMLTYKETYTNLNAQILFSHIHFGFPREATGIMVFLCGPAAGAQGGPPAGTPNPPPCPDTTSGTVTGSVTAANVIGPNTQGITPGADFAKVVQALREGAAYVNVHTTRSPSGEIRGQVRRGDDDGDDR
jgi:CHRD domain-containing protein